MESLKCLSKETIDLLKRNNLINQLIKAELVKNLVSKINLESQTELEAINQFKINLGISDSNYQKFLLDNNLNEEQFLDLALYKARFEKLCKDNFNHQVSSHYLKRKDDLDIIIYSLIRVSDLFKANEIYLRLLEKEAEFGELASSFSEGIEKKTRGIIGPAPIMQAHPKLRKILTNSQPNKINPPIELEGFFLITRLECLDRAVLDDFMKEKMREELFNNWIEIETKRITSELTNNDFSEINFEVNL